MPHQILVSQLERLSAEHFFCLFGADNPAIPASPHSSARGHHFPAVNESIPFVPTDTVELMCGAVVQRSGCLGEEGDDVF